MTDTITAPTPGIFWHRPSPDEPPFATEGTVVRQGDPVGVIEVMKMFMNVVAPKDCVFIAYRVENGGMVAMGDVLVEIAEQP